MKWLYNFHAAIGLSSPSLGYPWRPTFSAALPADPLAAFEPAEGLTAAFVVTHKGRIIGERYGDGITMHTPLESWSMGKSLTATLMGVLIEQGVYDLWQPAPVPEWQTEGDPRQAIRIADIRAS